MKLAGRPEGTIRNKSFFQCKVKNLTNLILRSTTGNSEVQWLGKLGVCTPKQRFCCKVHLKTIAVHLPVDLMSITAFFLGEKNMVQWLGKFGVFTPTDDFVVRFTLKQFVVNLPMDSPLWNLIKGILFRNF